MKDVNRKVVHIGDKVLLTATVRDFHEGFLVLDTGKPGKAVLVNSAAVSVQAGPPKPAAAPKA
jgi:hypothetical protein